VRWQGEKKERQAFTFFEASDKRAEKGNLHSVPAACRMSAAAKAWSGGAMAGVKVYEERSAVASGRKKPPLSEFKTLTDQHRRIIELMTFGLDQPDGDLPANKPLTLVQASDLVGCRRRQAREIAQTDVFIEELNKQVRARQLAERPRNLQTAIEIRDDEGDGSAATKTVRLKAIASIEGKTEGGSTVNVQINQQTVNQVSPGYVIRLDEPAPVTQQGAIVIEGEASE
jgi:hypothetical protein